MAVAAALVVAVVVAPTASALDQVNTNPLRKAVTVNGMLRHERALQAIANANMGTRVSGTAATTRRPTTSSASSCRPATR